MCRPGRGPYPSRPEIPAKNTSLAWQVEDLGGWPADETTDDWFSMVETTRLVRCSDLPSINHS